MNAKHLPLAWLALAVCVASVGCQTLREGKTPLGSDRPKLVEKLDIPNGVPWKSDKPKTGVPRRIVATWKDTVLQRPGQPAERGFGGRLFFYDDKAPKPIAVEGQLVVYAFDEAGRKPTDNKPSRRFVFPIEQFVKHQSDSELGVSYSFWLPWDKAPGVATDVSLIARFEPVTGGAMVMSDQSTARLPGDLSLEPFSGTQIAKHEIKPTIQQVSHRAERTMTSPTESTSSQEKRRMETTSIKLPKRSASYPAVEVSHR